MVSITFRTSPEINNKLNYISEVSGIPKSSLILYATNEFLRLKKIPCSKHTNFNSSIRTSLRISDDVNKLISEVSKKYKLNRNEILNYIVDYYIKNNWIHYY